jgi:hypothetical protein
MMTAKEYVEGKVKSYTRLAERCRREAEASDDIVVRAEYSARASVWEMCAEEMDNVREILEEESGESRMPDTVHHVMWYTVYDAKTGDLIASGTSEMCARRLGYKSANSFASASCHGRSGRHPACKYIFEKERIRRDEVDSLPPIRRKKRRACPCANTDKPKG